MDEGRKKRVIIIDDDAVLRRGLVRVFQNENFKVFDFADGKHALDFINKNKADLIICDLKLPDTDGLEILKTYRQIDSETPFILVTGYFTGSITKEALSRGADLVFEKPIDVMQLRSTCQKFFG